VNQDGKTGQVKGILDCMHMRIGQWFTAVASTPSPMEIIAKPSWKKDRLHWSCSFAHRPTASQYVTCTACMMCARPWASSPRPPDCVLSNLGRCDSGRGQGVAVWCQLESLQDHVECEKR